MKLLILDLDETLYHTFIKPLSLKELESPLLDRGLDHMEYITIPRPGVEKFLDFTFDNFKVAIWTAAYYDYASSAVTNLLNIDLNSLEFFYHKKNCTPKLKPDGDFFYQKKISKLRRKGWNLKNVIMLDNKPQYIDRYSNAMHIEDFLGFNENDKELERITNKLKKLIK